MSKIGVGVGEDFPVDDGPERGEREEGRGGRGGERDWDAEYAARHEAHRRWHEGRREWKRQWKEQWRAQRHAFHEANAGGGAYAGGGHGYYGYRRGPRISWQLIVPLLALCGIIALVGFAFTHIYALLGIIIVTALIFAYRRGIDPFDFDFFHDHHRGPPPAPKAPDASPNQTQNKQDNT